MSSRVSTASMASSRGGSGTARGGGGTARGGRTARGGGGGYMRRPVTRKELGVLFDTIDEDKSGWLSVKELKEAVRGWQLASADALTEQQNCEAERTQARRRAVEMLQAQGGLFIADEVQPGFGRTGQGMWGFSRHGVSIGPGATIATTVLGCLAATASISAS